jgi:predicted GNAT superfamily acetyltransferase
MTGPAAAVGDEACASAGARDEARAVAAAAAASAGVELREVTDLAGFGEVQRLFDTIWRPDPKSPPVTSELLRALTKAGNYVAAASRDGRMVGACVGFFGPPGEASMHSHIAGVIPELAGRSVGYALKLHQRAWALDRGVRTISWTFDPLMSRNAYFNLVKLGATAIEYLPDFYGGMHDGINGGDETDRLLVRWQLDAPRAAAETGGDEVIALGREGDGAPAPGSLDGQRLRVAVPADIAAVRAADPDLARRWRAALREVLAPLMAGGARVTGFDKAGWYLLRRQG